jgi:hypothetical protein
MPMRLRHSEPPHGIALEIEFDHHRGLIAVDPSLVAWIDGDRLRRFELHRASIRVPDMDAAARQKTHVRVHAQVAAYDRLHVSGPLKPRRINQALDTGFPSTDNVELYAANFAMLGAGYRGNQWIGIAHMGILLIRRRILSETQLYRIARRAILIDRWS